MRTINLKDTLTHQRNFLKTAAGKGRSANSLKCYRLDFEVFNSFLTTMENKEIQNFNKNLVDAFEHFLEKKYKSINSRRRKLQTLRLFFDYLVEKNVYHENPIKKIASAPKSILPPMPTLYPEVFMANDYLRTTALNAESKLEKIIALRNRVLFVLIYECCISVSALSVLEKDDLFLDAGPRILVRPKKRDPYTIPIPEHYKPLFSEYLDLLVSFQNEKFSFKELLFYANSHTILKGSLSPRGIENFFKHIDNHLKISITPKSLRQSGILKWIREGHSEGNLKEWLGVAPSYNFNLYKKYIKDQLESDSKTRDHLDYKSLQV